MGQTTLTVACSTPGGDSALQSITVYPATPSIPNPGQVQLKALGVFSPVVNNNDLTCFMGVEQFEHRYSRQHRPSFRHWLRHHSSFGGVSGNHRADAADCLLYGPAIDHNLSWQSDHPATRAKPTTARAWHLSSSGQQPRYQQPNELGFEQPRCGNSQRQWPNLRRRLRHQHNFSDVPGHHRSNTIVSLVFRSTIRNCLPNQPHHPRESNGTTDGTRNLFPGSSGERSHFWGNVEVEQHSGCIGR